MKIGQEWRKIGTFENLKLAVMETVISEILSPN